MVQLPKSKNPFGESSWSEECDGLPLKQRLKLLHASVSDLGAIREEEEAGSRLTIRQMDVAIKAEEDYQLDSQDLLCACSTACTWEGRLERVSSKRSHHRTFSATDVSFLQGRLLSTEPVKVEAWCSERISGSASGNCLSGSSNAEDLPDDISTMIAEDLPDDIDHISLKERQRMLLSRKLAGLSKSVFEGNLSGLSTTVDDIMQNDGIGKEGSVFCAIKSAMGQNDSYAQPDGNSSSTSTWEAGSSNGMVADLSSTIAQCPVLARHCERSTSIESGNSMKMRGITRLCSPSQTYIDYDSYNKGNKLLSENYQTSLCSDSPNHANVKVEPSDNGDLYLPDKKAVDKSCFHNLVPVKSELEITDEAFRDKMDHMLLRERMNSLVSGEVPNSCIYGKLGTSKYILPSTLDCTTVLAESSVSLGMKRSRKRRKTATDSVETALEEDAPGLLQVLIDKGVSVNEIKLYGELESDEALDDSSYEENFTELEAVISKLFSQRESLLKFATIRCQKGERASYCLSCLFSLVEQARYLQFRSWPVEWGWCRDLQSFIFVFNKHNRIVLERPEYGYATYFFELVDSLSVHWQIKRLVSAMKLTSCSRVTLIENRALVVGDDLTEGEARVLMEYGWTPETGLGTMLKYCDRVVHDRKTERDNSEWRSKIGKLLMDGYKGGTIVSTNIPKKIVDYDFAHSPDIKLEL